MKRTMRVFFPCLWRRNLPCFSSHAVVGGGHPRAGDRCGWAVGHAERRRAGSQGQGRYRLSNTYDKISHSVNRYSFFYLFLYRIYWSTVLNPLRWAVLFIHPVLLFHFNCLWSPLCLFTVSLQDFVSELLDKIRGMQKLSTPQKKWWHRHPCISPSALVQHSPSCLPTTLNVLFFQLMTCFTFVL